MRWLYSQFLIQMYDWKTEAFKVKIFFEKSVTFQAIQFRVNNRNKETRDWVFWLDCVQQYDIDELYYEYLIKILSLNK